MFYTCNWVVQERRFYYYIYFPRYLDRFNEELEQINIKSSIAGRQGRQHAGREDAIKMMLERDTRDFESSGLGSFFHVLIEMVEC